MRGAKPKAAEVKRREGNAGKRPIGDPVNVGKRLTGEVLDSDPGAELVETEQPLVIPDLPEHLALTDELDDTNEARTLWTEICTLLIRDNIIVTGDLIVLTSLVESIMIARKAWQEIMHGDLVVETSSYSTNRSSTKPSPWLKVRRDATAEVLKIAEHYALTPVARARLGLAVGAGRKLWQELEDGLPENPLERRGADDETLDGDMYIDIEGSEAKSGGD